MRHHLWARLFCARYYSICVKGMCTSDACTYLLIQYLRIYLQVAWVPTNPPYTQYLTYPPTLPYTQLKYPPVHMILDEIHWCITTRLVKKKMKSSILVNFLVSLIFKNKPIFSNNKNYTLFTALLLTEITKTFLIVLSTLHFL